MYTPNAYYPSTVDGNLYETYIQLANGQLAPICFLHVQDSLKLVYYTPGILGHPPVANDVQLIVNNCISNIVYYQPQGLGQTQLLYCVGRADQSITLVCNTAFQQFSPVNFIKSSSAPVLENDVNTLLCSSYIEQNPNRRPVQFGGDIPQEILRGLQAVQNGSLRNVMINSNQDGFRLTAEDLEGSRYILEKRKKNDIERTIETIIDPADSKEFRQKQVKQLRLEKKKTQTDIANYLGVSQKTISNDIKELGIK